MPPNNCQGSPAVMLLSVALAVTPLGTYIQAQPTGHMPATLAALEAYPSFFHRVKVVVRAKAEGTLQDVFVTDGERRVRALNVAPPVASNTDLLEIEGTYWDVGRLRPGDPRVADHDIVRLSERVLGKPWPSSGELKLLIADSTSRADETETTTIRNITLEPSRYRNQPVTLTGRFRGRNLYGDLPEAPGVSSDDFVLQSGGAAVWVVGMEPQGNGFELDVMARVDTSRWLEVTGIVSGRDQLLEIDARTITAIDRSVAVETPAASLRPVQGPAPEVIFSTPTPNDTGVATSELVRFQFSRDMNAASFSGNVEASYVGNAAATNNNTQALSLELTVEYRPRNRVLNVNFAEPLLPYRPIEIKLGRNILALDGASLVPYSLQFATGGP